VCSLAATRGRRPKATRADGERGEEGKAEVDCRNAEKFLDDFHGSRSKSSAREERARRERLQLFEAKIFPQGVFRRERAIARHRRILCCENRIRLLIDQIKMIKAKAKAGCGGEGKN
jgi:hypothetical protein